MLHLRNSYIFSQVGDDAGLHDIHFEAWDKQDAIARAECAIERDRAYTISRNGLVVARVSLARDGVWREIRYAD